MKLCFLMVRVLRAERSDPDGEASCQPVKNLRTRSHKETCNDVIELSFRDRNVFSENRMSLKPLTLALSYIQLFNPIQNPHLIMTTENKELFELETEYNKDVPPSKEMEVAISLFIKRVSAVDENKEEISLDVFLHVYWEDPRISIIDSKVDQLELTWNKEQKFWVPDLYIRQLREMKVLSVFQDMAAIRMYRNNTLRISIGATIILKCDMDFRLYPLDVQTCLVDFSSYKYTASEMRFRWKEESALTFPSDFADGCRLPRYVVSFAIQPASHLIYYGESNHSAARLTIILSRELRSHLLESYLPSTLFVIMSWGGFIIMPEVVPGRVVLLVTTLLSLVTMFDTVRNNSPNALELKCIEVWIISCTLFVFFALMEYFVVLFGMRYDKHWRHPKHEFDLPTTNKHNTVKLYGNQKVAPIENNVRNQNKDVLTPISITTNLNEENRRRKTKLQLRLLTHHVILYCGSQRGILDRVSLTFFPICFLIFSMIYWFSYLSEANRAITI